MALPPGTYPIGGAIIPTAAARPQATAELRDAGVLLPEDGRWLKVNDAGDDWEPLPAPLPAAIVPHYRADAVTYDAANDELEVSLHAVADAEVPDDFEFYARLPDDIDRAGNALDMVVGGTALALVDVRGNPVTAKQLTPGSLHRMLVGAVGGSPRRASFTEVLPTRPKDYLIRAFVSEDRVLDAAEIAAATASTLDGFDVALLDWPTGEQRYYGFGVPADTPPIATFRQLPAGAATSIALLQKLAGTMPDADGRDYVWWLSYVTRGYVPGLTFHIALAEVA